MTLHIGRLHAPFTISLIQLYFIMIFIMVVVTVNGIFMTIIYFLTAFYAVCNYVILVLQMRNSLGVSTPGHCP